MAEIQPEKEKEDGEAVVFDYLRNISVNVRRPDSVSAKNVNLGNTKKWIQIQLLQFPSKYLSCGIILAGEYLRFLKSSYPDLST